MLKDPNQTKKFKQEAKKYKKKIRILETDSFIACLISYLVYIL